MEIITEATGQVKVGGSILPGIFQSLEINVDTLIDEVEVEGMKKKPKQINGYEDASVKLNLVLNNDDGSSPYNKLEALQNIFKKPGQDKPVVYDLYNRHTQIRGINKVIFKNLTTVEDNANDLIRASCEFIEFSSISIQYQNSATTAKTTPAPAPAPAAADNDVPSKKRGKVTAKSGLNVRRGPSTGYAKIRALTYGSRIDIYKESGGWYKISTGEEWVSGEYVQII